MEALSNYNSSGEEEEESSSEPIEIDPAKMTAAMKKLDSAPDVPIRVSINWKFSVLMMYSHVLHYELKETQSSSLRLDPSAKEIMYNPTVEQLYAPEVISNVIVL